MTRTQDRFTFVIPSAPADLTPVEAALAHTIQNTSQDGRATVVGLSNHGQISRRESKLTTGEADTFLEVYPGHYLMRMGRASPSLREAMIAFLRDDAGAGTDVGLERDVSRFVTRMLGDLAEINRLVEDDSLSPSEAASADSILQDYQARVHELRKKLSRRARGGRQ